MKEYKSTIRKVSLRMESTDIKKAKISSSRDAAKYMKQFYHEDMEIYESAFMLLMNRANNTIGYVKISQGGIGSTVMDVTLIAKYAVESLASAVIIAHNHPSGNLEPSSNDKDVTKKVKEALKLFDISLLDHLILTENSHYSFADELGI